MFNIPEQWLVDKGFKFCDFSRYWMLEGLVVYITGDVVIPDSQLVERDTVLYPRSLEQLDCLIQMLFPPEKT